MADAVVSTSGMIRFAAESEPPKFIVGTEVGLLYPLAQKIPGQDLLSGFGQDDLPGHEKDRLQDVFDCLEKLAGEVKVPEEIRLPALAAVTRMIDLAR